MTPHDKIRAVLKAATPGPWKHNPDFETIDSDHSPSGCVARIMFYNDTHRYDALLIANAPQWIAQLLDEVAEAQHAARNAAGLRLLLEQHERRTDPSLSEADTADLGQDVAVLAMYLHRLRQRHAALVEVARAVAEPGSWNRSKADVHLERLRALLEKEAK